MVISSVGDTMVPRPILRGPSCPAKGMRITGLHRYAPRRIYEGRVVAMGN
ncbi:hypothetical protein FHS09_002540 [Microbulbifer rhizosphaerae]|uniref:Uncharacterized protein n=1 Tax=Microbulbifer rhizosphaerae TaxID=1562603 RepID=A0A7W4WCJ7_9GAMM|nr:hypothetical protein [Microbulbifer rhizosphaerae]